MASPRGFTVDFQSHLHRALHERLDQLIAQRSYDLGNGSAKKDGPAATAAAYHEAIGYIRALRECQNVCKEVAEEIVRAG